MIKQEGENDFGLALKQALLDARLTQAKLSREIHINEAQVSRWVNGKATPHIGMVKTIEEVLNVDLSNALTASLPTYELYVSAPITGLGSSNIKAHHSQVNQMVEVLEGHVNSLYWPGRDIVTSQDLESADIATERNLSALHQSSAFLFIQIKATNKPSSSLIELGIALGMNLKTTIIIHEDLDQPFMFDNFGAVAATLSFMPKARIYRVNSITDACNKVERNGRALLGLG